MQPIVALFCWVYGVVGVLCGIAGVFPGVWVSLVRLSIRYFEPSCSSLGKREWQTTGGSRRPAIFPERECLSSCGRVLLTRMGAVLRLPAVASTPRCAQWPVISSWERKGGAIPRSRHIGKFPRHPHTPVIFQGTAERHPWSTTGPAHQYPFLGSEISCKSHLTRRGWMSDQLPSLPFAFAPRPAPPPQCAHTT